MVLAPSGTCIKLLFGEGSYGDKDGGTKLKILTKEKKNRSSWEAGDRTDCIVRIRIIPLYKEVEKTW